MTPHRQLARTLVVGNSGCGKSTFARRLGLSLDIPVIDLDTIHWIGTDYGQQRTEDEARASILLATGNSTWVVEGVYTWLALTIVGRATAMLWLDVPWTECQHGLLLRGKRHNATDAQYAALLTWAEEYWVRESGSSHHGHSRLYSEFDGFKMRFRTRAEADSWLSALGL